MLIKSKMMRRTGHMTPMGQKDMQTGLCCGHVKRYHLEDLGIDGKIITELRESGCYGVNRIHVALDRSSGGLS
jgi:hypothetical protein